MSKVSVIIPVYNVEKYLPKCIASVQSQTETDIEIILVDDGSTDSCGTICDAYATEDARIRVIHQENSGLGAARNHGLSVSQSSYVMFIDSDDYIESELIEKALATADKYGADIVVYGYQKVSEDGTPLYTCGCDAEFSQDRAYTLSEKPEFILSTPSACNKLFKKTLFQDILFPDRAWYEDLRTIPKLYPSAEKIYCIPDYFPYKYLLRNNSIMTNGDAKKTMEDRIAAVDSVFAYYKERNLYTAFGEELNWLYIFHGYFLPCREIMNFTGDTVPVLRTLRQNLLHTLSPELIQKNRYFTTLTKRENLIFTLLYKERYILLRLFVKINQLLKRNG